MIRFEVGKTYYAKVFYNDIGMEKEEYTVTKRTNKTVTFSSTIFGDKTVRIKNIFDCEYEFEFAKVDSITKISACNLVA